MQPLAVDQRLHCKLESTEDGYLLKYEHLHNYIPLLQAKRRRSGLLNGGYQIEPAFDCSFLQNTKDQQDTTTTQHQWATKVHPKSVPCCQVARLATASPRRRSRILRQLRSTFKPSLSQGVMDVSSQQNTSFQAARSLSEENLTDDTGSRECKCPPRKPVLAEVEGNGITNRYRFLTECPLFQDGFLGSLNIITNYIKCQPRKLLIFLTCTYPGSNGCAEVWTGTAGSTSSDENRIEKETSDVSLFSKDPDWNDRYQIYELDFGGRVNKDSIKNFQIERDGKVVRTAITREAHILCFLSHGCVIIATLNCPYHNSYVYLPMPEPGNSYIYIGWRVSL